MCKFLMILLLTSVSAALFSQINITNSIPSETNLIVDSQEFIQADNSASFLGNSKFPIVPAQIFQVSNMTESTNFIISNLIELGYNDCSVNFLIEPVSSLNNHIRIKYFVLEGKQYKVQKMIITGNKIISAEDIKKCLDYPEGMFIFKTSIFSIFRIAQDKIRLLNLYHSRGMFNFLIKRYDWEINETKKEKLLTLHIELEEGPEYRFGKTKISGSSAFSESNQLNWLNYNENDIYNEKTLQTTYSNIYLPYLEKDFCLVSITNLTNINTNSQTIDIAWNITENGKKKIEKILITGNKNTETEIIQRELTFRIGETFQYKKIQASQQLLKKLKCFYNIEFTYTPGSTSDLVVITIRVEESSTEVILSRLGDRTKTGFSIGLSLDEYSLFGTGRKINVFGILGQSGHSLGLKFSEPWLFNAPYFLDTDIEYGRNTYHNIPTDNNNDGIIDNMDINYSLNPGYYPDNFNSPYILTEAYYFFEAVLSKRIFTYGKIFISPSINILQYSDANFTEPLVYTADGWVKNSFLKSKINKPVYFKNSIGFGLAYNSTDESLSPQNGMDASVSLLSVGGFLGGDHHYMKPIGSFSFYYKTPVYFTLYIHDEAAIILPLIGQNAAVYSPDNLLCFDGLLKGRAFGKPWVLGEAVELFTLETRFSLLYDTLFEGTLFFDVGSLQPKINSVYWEHSISYGPGLRLNMPMLPIRFYVAWKEIYDNSSSTWNSGPAMPIFAVEGDFLF